MALHTEGLETVTGKPFRAFMETVITGKPFTASFLMQCKSYADYEFRPMKQEE